MTTDADEEQQPLDTAGDEPDAAGGGRGADDARRRSWPGAVARAAVVLVAAAIGYQLLIPITTPERSRLGLLVVPRTGIAGFGGKPATSSEKPASSSGLPALVAAAKAHPDRTGVWLSAWNGKAPTGVAVVAFLAPDTATAAKIRTQLAGQTFTTNAYANEGLTRDPTFAVTGLAGRSGTGATFGPSAAAAKSGTPYVGEALWTQGRVVALVEVASSGSAPRSQTIAGARTEAAHLATVEPGFTLSPTRYPPLATALWAAGAVVLAAIAALAPIGVRRRRARRERQRQEELARTIRVRGQTIVRHRRGS